MREALAALVRAESPSADAALCAAAGRVLFEILDREPDEIAEAGGREHYIWRWPGPRPVLLIGHLDTVWPRGTIDRWPYASDGDRATGPGCFDMKSGLLVGVEAIRQLERRGSLAGVTLLVNSDEEIGSTTSREVIEREARGVRAALLLEPGVGNGLKLARKGVGMYALEIDGRAAHAGLEPEKGVNALLEAAHQILRMIELQDPAAGTTVTPTVAEAGTARNVVPAHARVEIDVRVRSAGEADRVDAALRSLTPALPGAALRLAGGPNRPPLERAMTERLFGVAVEVAKELGITLGGVEVGGGSDGNFTAALGVETLDGLGAVGGNAHAEGEWVDLASMPVRAQLVAGIVERLLAEA